METLVYPKMSTYSTAVCVCEYVATNARTNKTQEIKYGLKEHNLFTNNITQSRLKIRDQKEKKEGEKLKEAQTNPSLEM